MIREQNTGTRSLTIYNSIGFIFVLNKLIFELIMCFNYKPYFVPAKPKQTLLSFL